MKHKKHNMQETSLEAYDELLQIGNRQLEILNALRVLCSIQGNATDQEIKTFLEERKGRSVEPNYVRPRRYELVNVLKLVAWDEKRECRITGKKALAWKVLDRQLKKYNLIDGEGGKK